MTGWPSLGWTTTKPGPWKASWKDSPEPRPMRTHLEAALDLRLQVRRPADRRLRVNEGRLLRVGQTRQQPVIGTRYRLILRWCLVGAR